jgi:hypothetical protein
MTRRQVAARVVDLHMTESLPSRRETFRVGHWTSLLYLMTVLVSCARGSQTPAAQEPPQPGDVPPTPPPAAPAAPAAPGAPAAQPPISPSELKVEQLVDEPILTTGHGAFFDRNGKQIPITLAFVDYAQRYYREQMAAALRGSDKQAFAAFEQTGNASDAKGQDLLVLRNESLEWLLDALPPSPYKQQVEPKIHALKQALTWIVPERADLQVVGKREVFTPSAQVQGRLDALRLERKKKTGNTASLATANFGQAYINECQAAGVPIPPPINVLDPNGTVGWKSQGLIPQAQQFIVGTPAELRSWKSASPEWRRSPRSAAARS